MPKEIECIAIEIINHIKVNSGPVDIGISIKQQTGYKTLYWWTPKLEAKEMTLSPKEEVPKIRFVQVPCKIVSFDRYQIKTQVNEDWWQE